MLGLNTCINRILGNLLLELLVAKLIELCAHNSLGCIADNSELLTDCYGGILMVARNHNGADSCLAALVNSSFNLRTNR